MSQPLFLSLSLFSGLWLAQVATPGPNFVRISRVALTTSRRAAMTTAAGTAAGNSSWCLAAAAGAVLLTSHPVIGRLLHLAGACYFAFLGAKLLLSAVRRPGDEESQPSAPRAGLGDFRLGFTTAIANPQAIIFFATIFVTMFPELTWGLLALVVFLVASLTLGWYAFVTTVLATARARASYRRLRPVIDALFGAVLLATAAKLLGLIK